MTQVLKQKPKKVSAKLNKILNNIGGLFGKLNAQVELAFKIGKEEGFTENEIAGLVRNKMKEAGYSGVTVWKTIKNYDEGLVGPQANKMIKKVNHSSVTRNSKASSTTQGKPKGDIDYQLDPEEKDFEELLAWENDLPGFSPELLLRYTIQLIKVSVKEITALRLKVKGGVKQ